MTSKLLNLTNEQILERARSGLQFSKDTGVKYHLEYPNGGSDPTKPTAFDLCALNGADFWVSDCIGFALWCSGISRHFIGTNTIPPFPDTPNVEGSYINCTAIVQEARGFDRRTGQARYPGGRFFKIVDRPVPGDLIVFSGRTKDFPNNPQHGHIGVISQVSGLISTVPPSVDEYISADTKKQLAPLRIIHCSTIGGRHDNHAVRETHAIYWRNRGAMFVHLNREELLGRKIV